VYFGTDPKNQNFQNMHITVRKNQFFFQNMRITIGKMKKKISLISENSD